MGSEKKRFTDQEILEWVERHDLRVSSATDARAAFEDAQTLHLTLPTPTPPADGEAVDFEVAARTARIFAEASERAWPPDFRNLGRAHLEIGKRLQACGDALSVAAIRARPLPADVQAVVERVESRIAHLHNEWLAQVEVADLRTLLAHIQRGMP